MFKFNLKYNFVPQKCNLVLKKFHELALLLLLLNFLGGSYLQEEVGPEGTPVFEVGLQGLSARSWTSGS